MKDFLKSIAFKALAVVALFLVGVMIYAASTGGAATIPATIVSAVVTPLQTIASSLSDGVNSFIGIFTRNKTSFKAVIPCRKYHRQNSVNSLYSAIKG